MPKKNLPKDFVYSEMLRWCIMLTATIFWYSDKNYVYLVQKFSVEKKNIGKMSPSYLTSVTLHRPSHTHQSEFAYLHWRGLNPTLSGPRKRAPYLATTEGPSRRCVLENSRVGDISRTEIKYSCAKKVLTIFFFGGGGRKRRQRQTAIIPIWCSTKSLPETRERKLLLRLYPICITVPFSIPPKITYPSTC